jgi:hypothetical protein
MYDPLVVDAFLEMHGGFVVPAEHLPQDTVALTARLKLREELNVARLARAPRRRIDRVGSNGGTLPYGAEVVGSYLARMISGSMIVLYTVDEPSAVLRALRAWGKNATTGERLVIPLGSNVDVAGFGTSSSIPLTLNNRLLAVLTIYYHSARHSSDIQQLDFAIVQDLLSASLPSLAHIQE